MERRQFLRTVSASPVAAVAAASGLSFADAHGVSNPTEPRSAGSLRITGPFDGAILHERFGEPVVRVDTDAEGRKRAWVRIRGIAPEAISIKVGVGGNGPGNLGVKKTVEARRNGGEFSALVPVTDRINRVVAWTDAGMPFASEPIRFVWAKNSFRRYRFQIDDNSYFLRDLYQNRYKSLFDGFYLGMLRDFHKKYGSRFVLNIFNATPERDFELHQLSDQYKSEWRDNADWLRLSFHAETEFPGRPYENDPPEILKRDFLLVQEQIVRFAGEPTWTPPGIIHFAEVRPSSFSTLRELGVRSLSGYFVQRGDTYPTSFHLPNSVCDYLAEQDGWYDFANDLVFDKLEMVVNNVPLSEIVPTLEAAVANPKRAEMIDLLTHEQYFWPFYPRYIAEHADRLDAALKFLTEQDYQPVFPSDGFYSLSDEVFDASERL